MVDKVIACFQGAECTPAACRSGAAQRGAMRPAAAEGYVTMYTSAPRARAK
eukprot:gene3061-858_t